MSKVMVHRFPGKSLPDALLDKIYATQPNVFGYVFLDGDVVSIDAYDEPKSKDSVKELLGAFSDEMLLIWDKFPEGYHLDDLQPNELHETLAVAAVGDFSNHAKTDSTRTPVYFMTENVIVPMVQKLWDVLDEDPDKLSAALDKESVKKELRNSGIKDTVIALVSTRGDNKFKLYAQDGAVSTFEWGRINTSFGYSEKEYPAEETMASMMQQKKRSRIKSKDDKPVEEEKSKETPISEPKKEENKNTHKPVRIGRAVIVKGNVMEFTVPNDWNKKSNGEKKSWQNREVGSVIAGWRKWKNGEVVTLTVPSDDATTDKPTEKITVIHDISKLKEATEFKKDTEPHLVKSADTLPAGSSVPPVKPSEIGIVSIGERTAFAKDFNDIPEIKELLKIGAAPIMTVDQLKQLEAKTPSFYEVSGNWLIEYLEVLKNEQKLKMIKEHSNIALAAFNTLLITNRRQQQEIAQLKGEKKEETKPKKTLMEKMQERMANAG